MQTPCRRTSNSDTYCSFVVFIAIAVTSSSAIAADPIRLKNGASVRGEKKVMETLSSTPKGQGALKQVVNAAPEHFTIARVENDWQIVFVPIPQQDLKDVGKAANFNVPELGTLRLDNLRKQNGGGDKLGALGSMLSVSEFDEFGMRHVKIQTPAKTMVVYQGITEIGPDHVIVESSNLDWKFGLGLKTVPLEIIEKLMRKKVGTDDANSRLSLALFFVQSGYYVQAFDELDAILRDFPARKPDVDRRRADYMDYFGREIHRLLKYRRRAGQHVLAEANTRNLLKQPLSNLVKQDVQAFLKEYEDSHQAIERAKQLLADWQAKLNDSKQEERLQPLRSEVNEQLDFETLPRLDAFLKAEADNQFEPAQRLALAYTGWVLGAANAIPDLDQAFRVWDARNTVLEFLRSDSSGRHDELVNRLQAAENYSPETIRQLVTQLPPLLEASEIMPGVPHQIETSANDPQRYWVMLPAEYTPHHNYPMVVALRSQGRAAEETLMYWGGDVHHPDLGNQRGYIVIAPEYAEKAQVEYSFGAPAHKCVLECLIDARKRFAVDSDRVFLAGNGMGGDAAFDIGMAHPDEFAGVIPMGGNAINYCEHYWENGAYTAWYVVGKGIFNGFRDTTSNKVFNNMMLHGRKFDLMLVEYIGRNGQDLLDEIPKCYDWMDLASHVRSPQPKEFKIKALRKSDNQFFWIKANGLPFDNILPLPVAQSIHAMAIDAKITPGNTIHLKAPTGNCSLRLTPELVDFRRKVVVEQVGSKKKPGFFVTPDARVLLEDLQERGDRKRLPLAVVNLNP